MTRSMTLTEGSALQTVEVRMELLDHSNETLGELTPDLGASVKIQTGAAIGRTLTGVVLRGDDIDTFDIYAHRLRPWMIVDGTSHPLGIFLPTDPTKHTTSTGEVWEVHGHDQGFLLTQTLRSAFGADKGDSVADAIESLAIEAGIPSPQITDIGVTLGTYLAWAPGTRILDAMAALCRLGGLTTPWFDASGQMKVTPLPYVGADEPAREWQLGEASVLADPITETYDQWNTATEWLAISKSDDANLAGRYRLPDSHPRSVANGALPIVRTIDVPGLASTAQCRDRARDAAQRDSKVHRSIALSVRADPTVEQHDIITYGDKGWLLASATIPLTVPSEMSVTLRESLVVGEGQ